MCTYPFAKKALTLHLACGEGRERYFGCNLMQRKVLASSHQHLMAEAPLFLRKQLTFFVERKQAPLRTDNIREPRPFHRTAEHGELLPKSGIVESQLADEP